MSRTDTADTDLRIYVAALERIIDEHVDVSNCTAVERTIVAAIHKAADTRRAARRAPRREATP